LVGKALELRDPPTERKLTADALVVFGLPSVRQRQLKL